MIDVNIEDIPDIESRISIKLKYKRYLKSLRGFSQMRINIIAAPAVEMQSAFVPPPVWHKMKLVDVLDRFCKGVKFMISNKRDPHR